MPLRKRIFLALPVPPPLAEQIWRWRERWEHLPVRWLMAGQLHITLLAPWDTDDVGSLAEKIAGTVRRTAPFPYAFDRVTYGPTPEEPRLIWAEGPTPPPCPALIERLRLALGKETDTRPFLFHLTVARFAPERFRSFEVKRLDDPVRWEGRADSVVIMESRLLPSGAEYDVLSEISLKA